MTVALSDARIEYYVRRIGQGESAVKRGISGTPLTKTIARWGDPRDVLRDDRLSMPEKVQMLVKLTQQYADAVDVEDDLAPYRWQKVGRIWVVHFAVAGVIKRGCFPDHVGFHQVAECLARQETLIESVRLAGVANIESLALVASDKNQRQPSRQDEARAVKAYLTALEAKEDRLASARELGDLDAIDSAEDEIDRFKTVAGSDKNDFLRRWRDRQDGVSREMSVHRSVSQNRLRTLRTLKDNGMTECADFLRRTIRPEGYGFAYRPMSSERVWLL